MVTRTASMRPRHVVLGAALTALLLVANVASVAAAVPPERSSGMTGTVRFRESSIIPAPICVYTVPEGGLSTLIYFRVRAPKVYWADDAPGNHGTVGWRVRVQEANDPRGPWFNIHSTTIRTRTARDDASADLANRTVPHEGRLSEVWYRLMSQIYWYDSGGTVIGRVKHWYRWYGRTVSEEAPPNWSSPPDQVKRGKCRNRWFM